MRYAEITDRHAQLADKEQPFFTAVVSEITKRVPEALEIWLHGSRATGEHRRTSDWDFIVYIPDSSSSRMIELADMRNRNGLAVLKLVAGRKVDVQAERITDVNDGFNRIARSEGFPVWTHQT